MGRRPKFRGLAAAMAAGTALGLVLSMAQVQSAHAGEDVRPVSVVIDAATPSGARVSTRKVPATVARPKTTVARRRTPKARAKATTKTTGLTIIENPAYTCAGLAGASFEPVFGEVFFNGPDATFECGLSDYNYGNLVAVGKEDSRLFNNFTLNPGSVVENFGRASISFARTDGRPGFQISMLVTGGRLIVVRGPSLDGARNLARIVDATWPKLNRQQMADVSFGECKGTQRQALGKELSPILVDVAVPQSAVNYGTATAPSTVCTLGSEGGDISVSFFGYDSQASFFTTHDDWRALGGALAGKAVDSANPGAASYRVALQTRTLGVVHITGFSQSATAFGAARNYSYAAQQARVLVIAQAMASL